MGGSVRSPNCQRGHGVGGWGWAYGTKCSRPLLVHFCSEPLDSESWSFSPLIRLIGRVTSFSLNCLTSDSHFTRPPAHSRELERASIVPPAEFANWQRVGAHRSLISIWQHFACRTNPGTAGRGQRRECGQTSFLSK